MLQDKYLMACSVFSVLHFSTRSLAEACSLVREIQQPLVQVGLLRLQ
jgi:hypothetical protein